MGVVNSDAAAFPNKNFWSIQILINNFFDVNNFLTLSTLLPFYPSTLLPFYPSTLPPFYPSTLLPFYPSTLLPFYLSTLLPFYPSTLLPFYPSTLLPFYPSKIDWWIKRFWSIKNLWSINSWLAKKFLSIQLIGRSKMFDPWKFFDGSVISGGSKKFGSIKVLDWSIIVKKIDLERQLAIQRWWSSHTLLVQAICPTSSLQCTTVTTTLDHVTSTVTSTNHVELRWIHGCRCHQTGYTFHFCFLLFFLLL